MSKQLKNMQKMLMESVTKMQEELGTQIVEGTSGGGAVKVQANGLQEIVSVKIDSSVVNPEEVDILEDLILVAVKDAFAKAQAISAGKMNQLTGGLNIPGLF